MLFFFGATHISVGGLNCACVLVIGFYAISRPNMAEQQRIRPSVRRPLRCHHSSSAAALIPTPAVQHISFATVVVRKPAARENDDDLCQDCCVETMTPGSRYVDGEPPTSTTNDSVATNIVVDAPTAPCASRSLPSATVSYADQSLARRWFEWILI